MFCNHPGVLRSLMQRIVFFLALGLAFALPPAMAQDGPVLELVEVKLPATVPDGFTVTDGTIQFSHPSYNSQFTWNPPPKRIDQNGFTLTLNVAAHATTSNLAAETSVHLDSTFVVDTPNRAVGVFVNAGESKSDSLSLLLKPAQGLSLGATTRLNIGASFYTGVDYTYRVVDPVVGGDTGDGKENDDGKGNDDDKGNDGDDGDGKLAASVNCPPSIIISALPSLNCHIVIASWRRNTATPVQVILPDALDFYGNHTNGIQLLQAAGSQDVLNWTAPYMWGMFVFACPSQNNTGANCFGSITAPGTQTVNIIVRQGSDVVPLRLDITATPRPGGGANACGFTVGQAILTKWNQMGGQDGVLGCAIGNEEETGRSPGGAEARQALFKGGVIVLHGGGRRTGAAFEVHGCIASRYLEMGGTGSWLGLPVGDESDMAGGRRSDFESGYIAWDQLTGGCIAMRDGSATFSFEPDTNRAGSDFTNFEAIGDRMEICRDACAAESSCIAYTYVRPGLQGPRAKCWLKSSVPEARLERCCISGVRR